MSDNESLTLMPVILGLQF